MNAIDCMWQQYLTTTDVTLENALAEILGYLWCEWYQIEGDTPQDSYVLGEISRVERIKETQ